MNMDVYRSNILMALRLAIIDQAKCEKDAGFTAESSFLAGLRKTYEHIQSGGQIRINGD